MCLVTSTVSLTTVVLSAACSPPPSAEHPATTTVTVAPPSLASPSSLPGALGTAATDAFVPPSSASSHSSVAPVAVGTAATDGDFAFTIESSDTDTIVDWEHPGEVDAQGIFVIVKMRVENIGTSAQTYPEDSQRLLDSQGRMFSPNQPATQHFNLLGGNEINPGNTADAGLVFDVPTGTQPNQYVLLVHGSRYSPGVTLSIPPAPPQTTFAPTADDDQRFLEKLASETYLGSDLRTTDPALAIKAGRDVCTIVQQAHGHIHSEEVYALLEQNWGYQPRRRQRYPRCRGSGLQVLLMGPSRTLEAPPGWWASR